MNTSRADFEPACPPVLPANKNSRRQIFWLIGGGLLLVALFLVFVFNPAHHEIFPSCVFHQVTGFYCPGCGATRALHQLLHGHPLAALHANALFMSAMPFVMCLAAGFSLRLWRRLPVADLNLKIRPWWLWAFLAAAIVFAILRNLPGFEFLLP